MLISMTKSSVIGAQQMSKEKETDWDEKRWEKHWAGLRESHKRILELLHKEARGLKGSQVR